MLGPLSFSMSAAALGRVAAYTPMVPPPFAPSDLSGLYQWSHADGQALGAVASWSDLSGNSRPWTQSTGGNQPTNQSAQANGHNALLFNGTSSYLTLADVLSPLTAGEVFIVGKLAVNPPIDAAKTGFWRAGTNGNADAIPYIDGNIYDGWGSTTRQSVGAAGVGLGTWFVYDVASSSSEWTARLNGTTLFTTATNTVGFSTAPALGRSDSFGTYYWLNGQLAEIIIYSRVLTSGERAQIRAYILAKYGV